MLDLNRDNRVTLGLAAYAGTPATNVLRYINEAIAVRGVAVWLSSARDAVDSESLFTLLG